MKFELTTLDYMDIEEAMNASSNISDTLDCIAKDYNVSVSELIESMDAFEEKE